MREKEQTRCICVIEYNKSNPKIQNKHYVLYKTNEEAKTKIDSIVDNSDYDAFKLITIENTQLKTLLEI